MTSKFRLDTVQVKQSKCIRSILFARNRESPHVYYKVLEILKLKNIFNLKIYILVYRSKYIKTKIPSVFLDLIPSVSEIHCYDTRYSANHNHPEQIMDYLIQRPYNNNNNNNNNNHNHNHNHNYNHNHNNHDNQFV